MTTYSASSYGSLAVRIKRVDSGTLIGSAIIYYEPKLKDSAYILTAAHCLYEDGDRFTKLFTQVDLDIFNSVKKSYETLRWDTKSNTYWFNEIEKDVAVLVIDKAIIEKITGLLPTIPVVKERNNYNSFFLNGFSNATQGQELDKVTFTWKQLMPGESRFQLILQEDYTEHNMSGFSGSGIYVQVADESYLFGIASRYRSEERGKVLYCQFIESANELLASKFKKVISITYLGAHGLSQGFFKTHISNALANLGPRYTEEINVKLTIAKIFEDIQKGPVFWSRLTKVIDDWITEKRYQAHGSKLLEPFEAKVKIAKEKTLQWVKNLKHEVQTVVDIDWLMKDLENLDTDCKKELSHLYDLQRQAYKKEEDKPKDYSYGSPYENEIQRLYTVERMNYELPQKFESAVKLKVAENPVLIIRGEAGCGKSHLLGDIANKLIKADLPVFLLLGQNIKTGRTLRENIIAQLNLSIPFSDFVIAVNDLGSQMNRRILLLIDAINEGAGAELWKDEMAGFIHEIKNYPFIGLVLTIRETYFDYVIPQTIINDTSISFIMHQGFRGSEYVAIRLFCEHFGLKQPDFPILSPEFTNPLFLQLVCKGAAASPEKTFPRGFQGVKKIFQLYTDYLRKRFAEKRTEYKYRGEIIEEAIELISDAYYQNKMEQLSIHQMNELFDENFPALPHFLGDFIEENILTRNLVKDYDTGKQHEVIYFAYQRFGDFFIAEKQLRKYNKRTIRKVFEEDQEFGQYLSDKYWVYEGVLEAMAVLLPEIYSLEIFEVFDWVFLVDENPHNYTNYHTDLITGFMLDSFKWRTGQSIKPAKLKQWLRGRRPRIDRDRWLNLLLSLSAIPKHPLNSLYLHALLNKLSMPARDSFWQIFLYYNSSVEQDENTPPVRRLIEWAWIPSISSNLDTETATLAATALSWMLATTNLQLRDEATKTLVNLLEQQPAALLNVLKKFIHVNDAYIRQRLFAVAYGCTLRYHDNKAVTNIAQFVYDNIFKTKPPSDILLRDYARNIVEYALYLKVDLINVEAEKIRPPYNSQLPIYPIDASMKRYEFNHKDEDFKSTYKREYNLIRYDLLSDDFGYKEVSYVIEQFEPIPYSLEPDYKKFAKELTAKQRNIFKRFERQFEIAGLMEKYPQRLESLMGKPLSEIIIAKGKAELKRRDKELNSILNRKQKSFFKSKGIQYLTHKLKIKLKDYIRFDSMPVRRWIVEKAHKTGYDRMKHGYYDSVVSGHNIPSDGRTERIGQKYEKIAYHEIAAILTDNYKIVGSRYDQDSNEFYNGPWELMLRDIDPVSVLKWAPYEEEDDSEATISPKLWWQNDLYNNWNRPNQEWIESSEDLPSPASAILKTDELKTEWLYLNQFTKWTQPKPIGEEKYGGMRKEIWYKITGYLIKQKDKNAIIEFLKDKNFWGNWMPDNENMHTHLFNREKFWSPAYYDEAVEEDWETIEGTKLKLIIGTTDAKGNIERDRSGANLNYRMPCKMIFEGMGLQYASVDGELKDKNGNVIVTNVNPQNVMIKKKELLAYLRKEGLDIFWMVLGEKMAFQSFGSARNYFRVPCGIFYFEDEKLKGTLTSYRRK